MSKLEKDQWRPIPQTYPPENRRVLLRWLDKENHFYNPCIGYYVYITGAGGRWHFEPGFINASPDEWMELPK